MSDQIKHECGIAFIRLLKPLDYYIEKYGTALYGLNKLYIMMEKQYNRGQDGAGVASIKINGPLGTRYINRRRSNSASPIQDIFAIINQRFSEIIDKSPEKLSDGEWLKKNASFMGELLLGHLRYGTFGQNNIEYCHPFLRQNNWQTRNLVLAGNFNLTNNDELFEQLVDLGQHPKEKSDTVTIIEKIGHFLDVENERLFRKFKEEGNSKKDISPLIGEHLDIQKILQDSSKKWDGGYVMAGMIGHGDAFVLRDPNGIRPAYFYHDDEVVVVASERPAIQTSFNTDIEDINEIEPGCALIVKKSGKVSTERIQEEAERKSCSFERIYFSRGNDEDIYKERKELGRLLCPAIFESVDYDLRKTVFSFIPNTAETAFYGMVDGVNSYLNEVKKRKILELGPNPDPDKLEEILSIKPNIEKIAIKDAKLRTFITNDEARDDIVAHIYDITYGTIEDNADNLVVIDDSIVRGTTLKKSIVKILDRLSPKKIIVVSSAPQIRYPDCYGIDMAKLGDFIAFRAAVALLKDTLQENIMDDVYEKCKMQEGNKTEEYKNYVKEIYSPFTVEQISGKISELIVDDTINAEVDVIFQSLEGLHQSIPDHLGDWYFSGNYPTPGGNKVVSKAFINFMEGKNVRAY